MLLGDARRSQNNFFIQHSSKQENYLLYKKQVLEQITRHPVNLRSWTTKKGDRLIRIQPKLIPLTRVLIKRLYCGEQKRIARQFLNLLTPQGIAIWFMDDGAKSFKKKDGKIHALEVTLNTNLSQSENELIIAYFAEVWGFKWGLKKNGDSYRLRMGTKEGKRFLDFLTPSIPANLLYKIKTSLDTTATTYGQSA